MASELPSTKKCEKATKPVIVAGEGKTGTETMATVLAMLGLKVAHFNELLQCCEPDPSTHCIRPPPGKNCNSISWTYPYLPWMGVTQQWNVASTGDYDTMDFCQLDVADAYADVPIPSLAPYLYNAYGPGTKIIITEENAVDWVQRRSDWDRQQKVNDSAPLGYMFADSLKDATARGSRESEIESFKRSSSSNAYAYIAERALLECIAQPEDVLRVNIKTEASDPPRLWAKIAGFLGKSTEGIQTELFPRDVPGKCHSWNVASEVAYNTSNATILQEMVYGKIPSVYQKNVPYLDVYKKYTSCPSSGQLCPTCSYYPSDTGVLPRSMDDSAEIAADLLPVLGETNLELIEAIVAAAVEKASSGHEVHTAPSYKR